MSLGSNLKSLIERRGQDVILKKTSTSSYDTSTRSYVNTEENTVVRAYVGSYVLQETVTGRVSFGERTVLISGTSGSTPVVGDTISGVGDDIGISSVQTIYNRGVVVCYICGTSE